MTTPLDTNRECGSLDGMVRQLLLKGRPQTYREWSHMATCGLVPPDDRPEEAKVRELILEGKLPMPGQLANVQGDRRLAGGNDNG